MRGKVQHPLASRGDAPVLAQRVEVAQEGGRGLHGAGGRRVGPLQRRHVAYAPAGELQHGRREVRVQHLGRAGLLQQRVRAFAPQAVGGAGRDAARAARALLGRVAGDAGGDETREARRGVEAGGARQARVHDDAHALQGEARLRDARGEHHAPTSRRVGQDGAALLLRRQVAVEGQHAHVRVPRGERALRAADLARAGQEGQHVPLVPRERVGDGAGHGLGGIPGEVRVRVPELHGVLPSGGRHERCVHAQLRGQGRVERGGHDQDAQVVAQRALHLAQQHVREVRVEGPLVELVEDHEAHPGEFRVPLETAREDALRHDLHAGAGTHAGLEAHPVARRRADVLPEVLREARRDGPRRDPAWLEHHDGAPVQPRLVQEFEGHDGALARAGRGLQQHQRVRPQRGAQVGEDVVDGQGHEGKDRVFFRLTEMATEGGQKDGHNLLSYEYDFST